MIDDDKPLDASKRTFDLAADGFYGGFQRIGRLVHCNIALPKALGDDLEDLTDDLGLAGIDNELFLAGWSASRMRPESYIVTASNTLPLNADVADVVMARKAGFMPSGPFALMALPAVVFGPPPLDRSITESFYAGFDLEGEPDLAINELSRVLDMQRHDLRDNDIHWAGGWGQVSTINADGVRTQRLQTWPDQIGRRSKTLPIDWVAWCCENDMPPSAKAVTIRDQIRALNKLIAESELA